MANISLKSLYEESYPINYKKIFDYIKNKVYTPNDKKYEFELHNNTIIFRIALKDTNYIGNQEENVENEWNSTNPQYSTINNSIKDEFPNAYIKFISCKSFETNSKKYFPKLKTKIGEYTIYPAYIEVKATIEAKPVTEDKIPGGKGDNITLKDIAEKHNLPLDYIKKQYLVGIKIEYEHVGKIDELAGEIAKDHLFENGHYYCILVKSGIVDEKEALDLFKKLGLDKEKLSEAATLNIEPNEALKKIIKGFILYLNGDKIEALKLLKAIKFTIKHDIEIEHDILNKILFAQLYQALKKIYK